MCPGLAYRCKANGFWRHIPSISGRPFAQRSLSYATLSLCALQLRGSIADQRHTWTRKISPSSMLFLCAMAPGVRPDDEDLPCQRSLWGEPGWRMRWAHPQSRRSCLHKGRMRGAGTPTHCHALSAIPFWLPENSIFKNHELPDAVRRRPTCEQCMPHL